MDDLSKILFLLGVAALYLLKNRLQKKRPAPPEEIEEEIFPEEEAEIPPPPPIKIVAPPQADPIPEKRISRVAKLKKLAGKEGILLSEILRKKY
ncbi:MAG: hypothetical protein JSS32_10580 [Verrucomicrobia bacterium]|nr:hypothetical protein [Verrucomicrobiota bacterium]